MWLSPSKLQKGKISNDVQLGNMEKIFFLFFLDGTTVLQQVFLVVNADA